MNSENFYTCNRCGEQVYLSEHEGHIHPPICHSDQIDSNYRFEIKVPFIPVGIAACIN
jgi:hypothetical protein